jgi:hypothetical protein
MTLRLKIQTRSDFVDQSDGEVSLATTLDVPAWSTFLSEPATRDDVARMGLALYDAEARLLGDGLNLTASFAEDADLNRQDGAELQLASATNDDRYCGTTDIPAWVSDRVGGNNLTDWISDPTVRQYAEQLAESGRNHIAQQVRDHAGRGFHEVSDALQRHGLGSGRGMEGGSSTTTGFNAAMQQVIQSL